MLSTLSLLLFLLPVYAGQGSASAPQKLWAVVIGVSNYTHAEPLQYAASDARAFSEFLQSQRGGGFPADHVFTLLEDQASRTGILVVLDSIQEKAEPGDTVYIYIAGHGHLRNRVGYFIPSDGRLDSPAASAVNFSHLKDMIESGLAHTKLRVLVTDICNAGRVGLQRSTLAEKIQNLINEDLIGFKSPPGTFLNLLASRPTEASWEIDNLGGGVFTHTLLEALNGKSSRPAAPVVTAKEVVDYVTSEVPKFTANQQHPMVNPDFDGNLPLAFLDRPGPAVRSENRSATLVILNTSRASYLRVEWTDPGTQSKAVRQLPKDVTRTQIEGLTPGEIEFRFYDDQNRSRSIRVRLNPGLNTLDVLSEAVSNGIQVASLSLGAAAAQLSANEPEAVLAMRVDSGIGVFVDDRFWGSSEGPDRQLQLRGLTPGSHNLTLVRSPEREYRFRVNLFPGAQIFDVTSGELRVLASLQVESTQVPPGLPVPVQTAIRNFSQALLEERLIQPQGNSAWDYYNQVRDAVPPAVQDQLRNRLIIAMGNRAQRTILRYLRGGDIRWNPSMFEEGAVLLDRVQQLFKPDPAFQSAQIFFNGRALLERGQYTDAIRQLQRSVTLDTEASYAYNAIGLAYWQQNLLDQAIPFLQQALAITPSWNYPRNTLALIYLEQRRYDESEQTFRLAVQTNREDSTAYHGLAQLYILLNRWTDVESQLQQAILFDPGNAYAYETYGKLHQRRGDLPEAERMFRLAIRLEPDEPSFHVSLAELLRQMGRAADARQIFERASNQNPANIGVIQAYTQFLIEAKRDKDAQIVFDRAVKTAPGNANLHVVYGTFLRQHRREKDAEKQFGAAIKLSDQNAFAHYELANLFLARRKTSDAEKELLIAGRADSRLAAVPKLIGQIRFAQKRYSEALQEYRRALVLSIDRTQQQEIREYIAETEKKLMAESAADAVQKTAFWRRQQQAELLWEAHRQAEGARIFRDALRNLDPDEARLVAGTPFNLGNTSSGIHELVYRWSMRLIGLKDYKAALELMDGAMEKRIFGVVPNFSPLTIDSLMIPSDSRTPTAFSDFEVAQHPDARPHLAYAAAYAGFGDPGKAREYAAALRQESFRRNKQIQDALRKFKIPS